MKKSSLPKLSPALMINFDDRARKASDACKALKQHGFYPSTIIDVGVATGTPWLYREFSDSKFFLIEPLSCFEEKINWHLARMVKGSTYFKIAAGDAKCEIVLSYPMGGQAGGASSLISTNQPANKLVSETVQCDRLDSLISPNELCGKVLLKIDCQGYDLNVLKGAEGIISKIDCIIIEVGITPSRNFTTHILEYAFNHGFELFDIFDTLTSVRTQRIAQFDACLLRISDQSS